MKNNHNIDLRSIAGKTSADGITTFIPVNYYVHYDSLPSNYVGQCSAIRGLEMMPIVVGLFV